MNLEIKKRKLDNTKQKFIFLAGSIDNSKNNWRNYQMKKFKYYSYFDPTNYNFSSLNNQEMINHINWEFTAMEKADIILLNLLPNSLSPISLVELGLYVSSKKIIIVCPKEFYKSTYVYALCKKYNSIIFEKLEEVTEEIFENITK